MDAAGRACAARAAPFEAACEAVRRDADSGSAAIEHRLDDLGERRRGVVLSVGTVGDPAPAPRVPWRRRPWGSLASRLLSTPLGGVLLRTGQDHVACPLQFVSGANECIEIVGEPAWNVGEGDQVVPGGAESVWSTVQSTFPQGVEPTLRREHAVADAARLRRKAGHGTNHCPSPEDDTTAFRSLGEPQRRTRRSPPGPVGDAISTAGPELSSGNWFRSGTRTTSGRSGCSHHSCISRPRPRPPAPGSSRRPPLTDIPCRHRPAARAV